MNYPTLKEMKIADAKGVKTYLIWLAQNNLAYHLDDSVEDIIWAAPKVKPDAADIKEMQRLSKEMWTAADPWQLFENDRNLWQAYSGQN